MGDGGRLQWNSVQAPDFSSAMRGLQLAGDAFDGAAKSGQDMFGDIQAHLATQADRALQENMLKFAGDPDGLVKAQADGSIMAGVPINHLTPDQIASVPGRVSTLLNQQSTGLENADKTSSNALNLITRTQSGKDIGTETAARPLFAAVNAVSADDSLDAATKSARIQQLIADPQYAGLYKALPSATQANLLKGSTELQQGNANLASTMIQNKTGAFNYTKDYSTYKNDLAANTILQDIRGNGIGPQSFDRYMTMNKAALVEKLRAAGATDPEAAYEQARSKIMADPTNAVGYLSSMDAQYGNTVGANAAGSGGAGGATLNTALGMTLNGGQLPPTVKTVADAIQHGKEGVASGQPSNPMGIYQMMGGTMAKYAPAAGVPLTADFRNFDVQDKLARADFMDHRGSDKALMTEWTSLQKMEKENPGIVAKIRAMPWEQAREYIAKGETNTPNLNALLQQLGTTSAVTSAAKQAAVTPEMQLAADVQPLMNDHSNAMQVASKYVGKGEAFEGDKPDYVAQKITKFMQEHPGMNEAMAGYVLSRATSGDKSMLRAIGAKWSPFGDGLTKYTNEDFAEQLAHQISDHNALAKNFASYQMAQQAAQSAQGAYDFNNQAVGNAVGQTIAAANSGRNLDMGPAAGGMNRARTILDAATNSAAQVGNAGNVTPPPASAPAQQGRGSAAPIRVAPAIAHAVAPPNQAETVLSTINQNLTAARAIRAKLASLAKKGDDTPFNVMGLSGQVRKNENQALDTALHSGMPAFKQRPGESQTMWRGRVAQQLRLSLAGR